jgi:outer membrane immunogenic protein
MLPAALLKQKGLIMRRITILEASSVIFAYSEAAFAADIITKAPEPPAPQPQPQPIYDWTGPYIGVFGGLAVGDFRYNGYLIDGDRRIPVFNVTSTGRGFIGGAQAGYDWQSGPWVFGAVADIAFTNYKTSISGTSGGVPFSAQSQLNYLGTVRARIGRAFDRTLLYAHGGFAYGETEQTVSAGGVQQFNSSQMRTGWTLGAGLEYALTDRVSFGTEYSYVDLGSKNIVSNPGGVSVDEDVSFHTLEASVNFRF